MLDQLSPNSVDISMTVADKALVKTLLAYSNDGRSDFSVLDGYPTPGFSPQILTAKGKVTESIACFLSDNLMEMRISDSQKIKDLSFLEKAPHLQKLQLANLPGIKTLSALSKLPELSALHISHLRQLSDIDFLTQSNIQCLDISLSADKISATRMADVFLRMPLLKTLRIGLFSLVQDKKAPIIRKKFEKAGRGDILTNFSDGYDNWPLIYET